MTFQPFHDYLGIFVDRAENGEAEGHLELASHHLNSRGIVHGGVLATLLDATLGASVFSVIPREWSCATISLSVQFLEGAKEGRLRSSAEVLRKGKKVAFAGGEVRDAGGRVVAAAQGSFHLWPFLTESERHASDTYVVLRGTGERVRVGKILAIGRNYSEHVAEMGWAESSPPVIFMKPATAIVHDGGSVRVPEGLGACHHEVEMVVVIGRDGLGIPPERALEHVLGYAVGLDMTLRDLQSEAKSKGEPWTLSKGFDTSAPVSTVARREEVGDGSGLAIELRVNGETRQSGSTSMMSRGVAALVAEASKLVTLERGDLIFTGTPAGVGPVEPGDLLEASLEKVGALSVRVERREA